MPCSRQSSETGTPLSACFKIPRICGSLNRPIFISNLLVHLAEKILLLNPSNFRGDYHPTGSAASHVYCVSTHDGAPASQAPHAVGSLALSGYWQRGFAQAQHQSHPQQPATRRQHPRSDATSIEPSRAQ